MMSFKIKMVGILLLMVTLITLTGCSSYNPADIKAFSKPHTTAVTAENYVLQPPDEVEIHCSRVPELHLQRQRIRPDGKISFENLGDIEAAGKTIGEVATNLRAKVLQFYTLVGDDPIDVRVVAYKSKVYYVLGQVYIPGPKAYTGRDSVLRALSEAQLNPMANHKNVWVIRPSIDVNTPPKIFKVNFRKMAAKGNTSKDVLLQEGDIIYVRPTFLASIALKIEEVVRPIARSFSTVSIVQRAETGGQGY